MNGRQARGEERSGFPLAEPVELVGNLLFGCPQIHRRGQRIIACPPGALCVLPEPRGGGALFCLGGLGLCQGRVHNCALTLAGTS